MKNVVVKTFLLCAAAVVLTGARLEAQTSADVVASPSVPAASLSKDALKDIFTGKTAYWDGGQAITIVVLTDKTEAGLQDVSGMTASSFRTFWQRLTFSGRGKQPKEVDSIDKLMSTLAESKGAIALVPPGTALNGVKKIEVK